MYLKWEQGCTKSNWIELKGLIKKNQGKQDLRKRIINRIKNQKRRAYEKNPLGGGRTNDGEREKPKTTKTPKTKRGVTLKNKPWGPGKKAPLRGAFLPQKNWGFGGNPGAGFKKRDCLNKGKNPREGSREEGAPKSLILGEPVKKHPTRPLL